MDVAPLTKAGIRVTREPLHTDAYRRDLWPRDTLVWLQSGERPPAPMAVASPTNAEQVAACVDWATQTGTVLVPYGAGSGVCGGARGRADSLVVDLKQMNRIRAVDTVNRTAHIEAGIIGQHLEDQLETIGWMTAHSPSSIACSTAGGYLAARSAGQFSSRYGVFDDMLLAAAACTPNGPLRTGQWTPKGQEDLLDVLCGSEGGLGVVTDMLVRIQPQPEIRWLRGYAFPSVEAAWDAMRSLMQSGLGPSVLRLYDPVDTKIGGKTNAADDKKGGGLFGWMKSMAASNPTLKKHLLSIPLAVPALLNRIGQSLSGEVLLIVGFEGPLAVVNASVESATPLLGLGRDMGAEPGEHWYTHRHDVSYKLAPVFIAGAFADTMEVATTWKRLPGLYRSVQQAIGRHCVVMAHFSHAYPEGCSIYFSFAGRGSLAAYDATWKASLQAAREAGGTVTHHHGVGVLKSEAATQEVGAAIRVWSEIKATWDPHNLMNPGRPFADPTAPSVPAVNTRAAPAAVLVEIDEVSLLAKVNPSATPDAIQRELNARGMTLRVLPDRSFGEWLPLLQRGTLDSWHTPLFGLRAHFEDGAAVQLGCAPRSAAGPDLRRALMRRATTEWVEVPIRPNTEDTVVSNDHPSIDQRDIRPAWTSDRGWGFSEGQTALADVCLRVSEPGLNEPKAPELKP